MGARLSESDRALRAFRTVAFNIAYMRTLASESDVHYRFARAIQLSARPIPAAKMREVVEWYRLRGKQMRRGTCSPSIR